MTGRGVNDVVVSGFGRTSEMVVSGVSRVVAPGVASRAAPGFSQASPSLQAAAGPHRLFDELLDLYVRDGFVYYGALRAERARLERYLRRLDVPAREYEAWSRDEKAAFWLNAYNAFVLKTVADRYPIRGSSAAYPPNSVRQIPGAFDKLPHRAAGRVVTLDAIEKTVLPQFRDPRLYLALGRGAAGSGRLLSEAYTGATLDEQLARVAREFAVSPDHIKVDVVTGTISLSPIVGWHEAEFVAAYAGRAPERFATRSPIERAVVALIEPTLLPRELELLRKNEFKVEYSAFDWRLNDLAARH